MTQSLTEKYTRLQSILKEFSRVLIAYSGGVDSVYLLKAAVDTLSPVNILACIGDSESLARSELGQAVQLAENMHVEVEIVHPHEMNDPDYLANPSNRCFHCKSHLYQLLRELADQRNYDAILCGTNADDLNDFRPGLQAAKKFGIVSPLEQAGLTKADIRTLSRKAGLPTWDKPAQPCLASRMAYGNSITPEKLNQIEQGEAFLRNLGYRELRVRHHDKIVRIEVPAAEISQLTANGHREQIVTFFKKLGFTYITLDLQGFRSGSGNEVLSSK